MKTGKNIIIIGFLLSLSLGNANIYAASSNPDPNMTKWGPKLSDAELASISKLSTQELAQMLKTGDTLHKFAALEQLKSESHGGLKKNFDLIMSIAEETSGEMILNGLIKPVKTTAGVEEKRMVDKYLDFIEKQLKDEKLSGSTKEWYIRNTGGVVYISPGLLPQWNPEQFPSTLDASLLGQPKNFDPNKLPIPYANDRVVSILVKSLESKDRVSRESAIFWLGNIGANDLSKADKIVSTLEAQIQKEDVLNNNEKDKQVMKTAVNDSLKRLKLNMNLLKARRISGNISDFTQSDPNRQAKIKLLLEQLLQQQAKAASEPNNKTK
jgi:hypothetical protein